MDNTDTERCDGGKITIIIVISSSRSGINMCVGVCVKTPNIQLKHVITQK